MAQTMVNFRMDEDLKKKYGIDLQRAWNEYVNCIYYFCQKGCEGKKDTF